MRHLLFTIIILLFSLAAESQTFMRIHQKNDTLIRIPVNTIDSVTYPYQSQKEGRIILPQGSVINANSLLVLSNRGESTVTDGKFVVDVFGNYTVIYAINSSDQVMLMSYQYPGISTNDISATSTALAMVMMSPSVFELSELAKKVLINRVLADDNFNGLLTEISLAIKTGRPIYDSTNRTLIAAYEKIFQSVSFRMGSQTDELPVNMERSFSSTTYPTFTVSNKSKSFTTVIGVYRQVDTAAVGRKKDTLTTLFPEVEDELITTIVVDGIPLITDLISNLFVSDAKGRLFGEDGGKQEFILLPEKYPGIIKFKFRTGKPGYGDGSKEHDVAFYKNLEQVFLNIISVISPEYKGCFAASRGIFYDLLILSNEFISSSQLPANQIIERVLLFGAKSTEAIFTNCIKKSFPDLEGDDLAEKLKSIKWLKNVVRISGWYSIVTAGINLGSFGIQWYNANPVIDSCYQNYGGNAVVPNSCLPCNLRTSVMNDTRDENNYRIVEIGDQTWFAENLRYDKNIKNIIEDSLWYKDTLGAWSYYDHNIKNDSIYGKLYNWYAVNPETNGNINVCPVGWHVPSIADWEKLKKNLSYLGLEATDTLGNFYNVPGFRSRGNRRWLDFIPFAIDALCFSALPGGERRASEEARFIRKGTYASWWASDGFLSRIEGEPIDCNAPPIDPLCILGGSASELIKRHNDQLGDIYSSTAGFASLDAAEFFIGVSDGRSGRSIRCVKD